MTTVSPAAPASFKPVWVCDVAIDEPLHDIVAARRADGGVFEQALVVLRAGPQPVATVTADLVDGVLSVAVVQRLMETLPAGAAAVASRQRQAVTPTATPSVTVVVCTRDRPAHLRACLERLTVLRYPALEVVVVDNAPSTDDTRIVVAGFAERDPRIRYVREDLPGLSRARNRGIAVASGEFVAFTDDDVRVDPCWVESLVRGFAQDDRIACVTGSVLPASLETPSQALFERAVAFGTRWGFEPRVFDLEEHRLPGLYPYQVGMFGAGNNMAFRRQFLIDSGGFDVALGAGSPTHGGEDLDSFLRVVTGGWRLAYEPAAMVWHVHRQSDGELRTQAFRYGVGLGALVTKLLLSRDDRRPVLARVPGAVSYFFRPTSDKNAQKGKDFPLSLSLLELGGLAYGPVAYLRGRYRGRVAA